MSAHPLSISRSTLELSDGLARLTVRMPVIETDHLPAAARDLGRYFRVDGESPVSSNCRVEDTDLVCRATFLQPHPSVVESDLAPAVLPHHIHTLHHGGRAFVLTTLQRRAELSGDAPVFPWWPIAAILAGFAIATIGIRSLRSRRTISHPG